MSIKRIALISFHACPLAHLGEGKAGGMNAYVRELGRHLAGPGTDVDIFTREHPGQAEEAPLEGGVRVVHLPGGPGTSSPAASYSYLDGFTEALAHGAAEQGLTYDVIHSHYWLSGEVGRRLAQAWDTPLLSTFHTLARNKEQAMAAEEPALRARVEHEVMRDSQLVIATTPHEKDALHRLYGIEDGKVEVVPCGVDLDVFHPIDKRLARKQLGFQNEKLVLYVGRLERIKGVDLLIQTTAVLDAVDKVRVLIVGGSQDDGRELESLKALAGQLSVSDRVTFVGRVEQTRLPLYYSAADVCVVPSYYESFGLVALEAMACGTPVVASRVGGLPWVVQHNKTGYLVPWHCPEPFANWLETLLSSAELRHKMGEAAREFAATLSWDRVAARIASLYASVRAPRGHGAIAP